MIIKMITQTIQKRWEVLRKCAISVSNINSARGMDMKNSEIVIKNLSDILLEKMGENELTTKEMAKKCGISHRKFCEIIYREKKGMNLDTLITVCENTGVSSSDILWF